MGHDALGHKVGEFVCLGEKSEAEANCAVLPCLCIIGFDTGSA
jgi:hypothetical protein